MSHRLPLRVTPEQWNDLKEHYQEDWTQADVEDIDFPEDVYQTPVDDHDRRYDDWYSTNNGDIGDDPPS